MTIYQFLRWMEDLPLQTLTDELKEEICTNVDLMLVDAEREAFCAGKEEGEELIKESIQNFLDDL